MKNTLKNNYYHLHCLSYIKKNRKKEEEDCTNLLNNSKIKIEIHGVGLVHD
jgi:hypothetical protein